MSDLRLTLNARTVIIALAVMMILGALGSALADRFVLPFFGMAAKSPVIITRREEVVINEGVNYAEVINQMKNSMVTVYVHEREFGSPNFQVFGQVTGVIVSSDGLIVSPLLDTRSGALITVLMPKGEALAAKVLARDFLTGLSLLKVEASGLGVARQGFSREVRPGERLILMSTDGSPFHPIMKSVLVSSDLGAYPDLRETYEFGKINHFLEIDPEVVSGGMAGGVVVNKDASLVGVVTRLDDQTKVLMVEDLELLLDNFFDERQVVWPNLPLTYQIVGEGLGLPFGYSKKYGLLVKTAAGLLKVNDLIFAVDGAELSPETNFDRLVLSKKAGQKAKLKLIREGQEMEIEVSLWK